MDKLEVRPNYDDEGDRKIASIFREYGWPSPISRQEECSKKVEDCVNGEVERMDTEGKLERMQMEN